MEKFKIFKIIAVYSQIFFVNSFISSNKILHFFSAYVCITNATATTTQIESDTIYGNLCVIFHLIFSLTLWEKCQLLFLFFKWENQNLERVNDLTDVMRILIKVVELKPNRCDSMNINHYVKAISDFLTFLYASYIRIFEYSWHIEMLLIFVHWLVSRNLTEVLN